MGIGSSVDQRHSHASIRLWLAIVMAIALSLFVSLQLSNASADTPTNVTVHSSDVGTSWYSGSPADTRSGGAVSFVTGPGTAPLGTGSLQLTTTAANGSSLAKAQLFNYSYEGTKLSDITALSYSDYHSSSSSPVNPVQRASINIEITDPVLGFTTLVYEPYEQGVTLADDTWQPWNTLNGQWWSTHTLPGKSSEFDTAPWSTVLSDYPNATITGGIGFNVGSGWNGTTSNNADGLAIGVSGATKIYDFEPTITPTNNVQMTVLDSGGNPISGVSVSDQGTYLGSLGTTDANGVVSGTLPAGSYTFTASLDGTTQNFGPVAVTTDAVTSHTFQTMKLQVNLQTCSGQGLAGGVVQYKAGVSTYYLGSATDANGVSSQELFPGSYLVTMNYQGAANQATVDFSTTNPYTFTTNAVTLVNPGYITYTAPNGYAYAYSGPTMQLLPATYTFHASGTSFDLTVGNGCGASFTGGVVRLVDHNGNGLAGGTASYYDGGWHAIPGTTDANGNLVFSAPSTFGFIDMNYKGGIVQQSKVQLNASNYTFKTTLATLKLEDADGHPLDTGTASFYAGSWQTFGSGSTSGGQVTMELLPASYSFAMVYNGSRQQLDGQNLATNPVIVFQTGRVTLYYSGAITWYYGSFMNFVKPTEEYLPGTTTFYFDGYGCQAPITIASGDHLVKSMISATLSNHSGAKIAGGVAQAYVGGWTTIGTTNGYGTACQLFNGKLGSVAVAMTYVGTRQQITQNQPTNSVYAFQTDLVTVQLKNSNGTLIDTGTASYYAGGWVNLGDTHGGQVAVELLPGTYSFALVYNGERQQISQAITANSNVVFQTDLTTVKLEDHNGNPLDTGNVSYYAGGWHTVGDTTGGQVQLEMLPGSYSFALVYNGERQQLDGQSVANPVIFQTKLATIQLQDHNGNPLDTGNVSYYAGGWHTIGDTSGGQIQTEMLPGSYSFAMTYLGTRQQLDGQNVNSTIVFKTGQVHSASGTAKQYYAGGWKTFTQDMELLPGTYPFSFAGHAQTSYTVTGGTTTTIY